MRVICILLARASSNRVVGVDAHHGTLGRVVGHGQGSRPTSKVFWNTNTRGCRTNTRSRQISAVPSAVTALAVHSIRTWPTVSGRANSVGPYLTLKPRTRSCKRIAGNVLVNVHRLRMLTEIVQSGESAGAMTLKWSLSGVFPEMKSAHVYYPKHAHVYQPYVSRQMLTAGEAQLTRREVGAEETLALFLLGRSLRIARHALVVRPVVFRAFLSIALTHFHVIRALRHDRSVRAAALQGQVLPFGAFRTMR